MPELKITEFWADKDPRQISLGTQKPVYAYIK